MDTACARLRMLAFPLENETEAGAVQRRTVYTNAMVTIMTAIAVGNVPPGQVFTRVITNGGGAGGLESLFLSMLTHPSISNNFSSWFTAWNSAFSPDGSLASDSGAFVYNFADGQNIGHACVLSPATVNSLFWGGANNNNNNSLLPTSDDKFPYGIFAKLDSIATFHIAPGNAPHVIENALRGLPIKPQVVTIFRQPVATPNEWNGTTWMKALAFVAAVGTVVGLAIAISAAPVVTVPMLIAYGVAGITEFRTGWELADAAVKQGAEIQNTQVDSSIAADLPQGTITVEIEPGGEILVQDGGGDTDQDRKLSEEEAK